MPTSFHVAWLEGKNPGTRASTSYTLRNPARSMSRAVMTLITEVDRVSFSSRRDAVTTSICIRSSSDML